MKLSFEKFVEKVNETFSMNKQTYVVCTYDLYGEAWDFQLEESETMWTSYHEFSTHDMFDALPKGIKIVHLEIDYSHMG